MRLARRVPATLKMSTTEDPSTTTIIGSSQAADNDVAKYKRVLSLARSSLEASQANLAVKDQQIGQLIKALEEEKKKNKVLEEKSRNKTSGRDDDTAAVPRKILCRVDIDGVIWILIEYDDSDDGWKSLDNEQDLQDFIQRIPGVPLVCPSKCLSADESSRILDESNRRIERIVEEFRRFKVRTEIARKQKDAETRQSIINGTSISPILSPSSFKENNNQDNSGNINNSVNGAISMDIVFLNEEIQRMKTASNEQESLWRLSYDKVVKENEVLRTKGGETLLAMQWRNRYESCLKEKEDLVEKLKAFNDTSSYNSSSKSGGGHRGSSSSSVVNSNSSSGSYVSWDNRYRGGGGGEVDPDGEYGNYTADNVSSKIQYVRHMIFQYLSCRDPEVKVHIETALMAIFRMTNAEREVIETIRKEEAQDALTSIADFFGSLSSSIASSTTTVATAAVTY